MDQIIGKLKKGKTMRVLGITFLIVGILVLGFGINSTFSVAEEVIEGVSGRYSSDTMWYIIGGAALIVGGAGLLLRSKKSE
jgi:LPXTG-motif cell wall-anchored protein